MTPAELEAVIKNHNFQLSAILQILPTLATKDDLKAFATKEDLRAYATKEDLEDVKRHTSILIEDVRSDIRLLAEYIAGRLSPGSSMPKRAGITISENSVPEERLLIRNALKPGELHRNDDLLGLGWIKSSREVLRTQPAAIWTQRAIKEQS